jgi:putative tryptophan/tyrosine transport system substrate-binding protein
MKRREFVVGGVLTLGLGRARAQSSTAIPRIGWLLSSPPDKPQPQWAAFVEALRQLGWSEGNTVQIERRYLADVEDKTVTLEQRATEIVALNPNVIFTSTSAAVSAVLRQTRTIPIVFVAVNNPLAAGFVSSLAHPGGNITGFANFEPTSVGKMIELLKEIAPHVRTVAFMYSTRFVGDNKRDWVISREATEDAARRLGVQLMDAPIGSEQEIGGTFAKLGADPTVAVLLQVDGYFVGQRNLIVQSAAQYRVPTIYPFSLFATAGGLISYGNSLVDQYRQAAGYVDRILKGTKPNDLPVQMPTKYELIINMKAANRLGLNVPPALLSIADELIE